MSNRSAQPARRFLPRVPLAAIFLLMIPAACGFDVWRRYLDSRPVVWEEFSAAKRDQHLAAGRPVVIYFTADWLSTLSWHRRTVVETPQVAMAIKTIGGAAMTADYTARSPEIAAALQSVGMQSVPTMAIYPAGGQDKPIVINDFFTIEQVLQAIKQADEVPRQRLLAKQRNPTR